MSLVLNQAPAAQSIPQDTKDRVIRAAAELNYRPNLVARSLRQQRTFSIGVLVPEITEGYAASVLSGIEEFLSDSGYVYFISSHRRRPERIKSYPHLLMARAIEGLILVDSPLDAPMPLPTVSVSGHQEFAGLTNVILDHRRAAELALRHLYDLGHRHIAFMRGQPFSSDTEERWNSIQSVAQQFGLSIRPELTIHLKEDIQTPEVGYPVTRRLIDQQRGRFTAVFAFNDMAAIGAIRALADCGLRVPRDVSVVGFDDISSAAYFTPRLTTVRQPLFQMGQIAARTLLQRLSGEDSEALPFIAVEPELMLRESTGPAPKGVAKE